MSENKVSYYTHAMKLAGDALSRESFGLKVDKVSGFMGSQF